MSDIGRPDLFGKLNPLLYKTLEGATAFCKLRGNPYVELAHWLHQILHHHDSDLHRVARRFDVDLGVLLQDTSSALDKLPRGATAVSDLSEHVDTAVERAWVFSSLRYRSSHVRSAHLLAGMLKHYGLRNVLLGISPLFARIVPDVFLDELESIVSGSPEDGVPESEQSSPAEVHGALARYAVDLTARAQSGHIDPVVGRDVEIRQIIDILMRRRQNNPLLTGEAGVGKTAVAEALALRLVAGDVPPPLRDVRLLLLDIGLLQAGASAKGEFEQRLRSVIEEVQASARPIILFIDEIHTLVGAGGAAGTGDAANLLKPVLARGQLRTVGATTWCEYKKYIEKDPALTRRFQLVQVHEPDEAAACGMLRGLAQTLQVHHGVLLLDEAIEAAVRLSHRYIPARQLPDKAVALLDTACARVAVSQSSTPAPLEDVRRRIQALEIERDIALREAKLGCRGRVDAESLESALAAAYADEAEIAERWECEKALVARVLELREQLLNANDEDAAQWEHVATLRHALSQACVDLQAGQDEAALIFPSVDAAAVAAVVADWTGIPVQRMLKNEAQAVLGLADALGARVLGQRHGLDAIAQRVQSARARLTDPGKPLGVFMLCGPSGVGKTETALALAEILYGGEQNLISINMSEFQEAHTVSTLKGAPPGYVGYGEGGVLTEAVRRRPHSVVLLDEVEKAHRDVHEMFFQVFDKGWMEDGEGRYIDFRNTIILLTSNVGSDLIMNLCADADLMPTPEGLAAALRKPLREVFPPALLGRLTVVPYYPLSEALMARIVELQVRRVERRLAEHHGVTLELSERATALIVGRCTEVESGGRLVEAILTDAVLPRISQEILASAASERALSRVFVGEENAEFSFRFE